MNARRSGFSVVELVIALLVVAVAVLSMSGVMVQTTRMQGLGLSRAELTAVAESNFEELRAAAAGASAIPAALTAGGSLTADEPNRWDETRSAAGRSYRRRWLVAAGPQGSVQVTLRVAPAQNSRHELSHADFTTLIFVGE